MHCTEALENQRGDFVNIIVNYGTVEGGIIGKYQKMKEDKGN